MPEPTKLSAYQLKRVGVTLVDQHRVLLRCDRCGQTWSPNIRSGRYGLPPGWWRCPERLQRRGGSRRLKMRPEGLEPPRVAPQDPKSCASPSSATVAVVTLELNRGPGDRYCPAVAFASHCSRVSTRTGSSCFVPSAVLSPPSSFAVHVSKSRTTSASSRAITSARST